MWNGIISALVVISSDVLCRGGVDWVGWNFRCRHALADHNHCMLATTGCQRVATTSHAFSTRSTLEPSVVFDLKVYCGYCSPICPRNASTKHFTLRLPLPCTPVRSQFTSSPDSQETSLIISILNTLGRLSRLQFLRRTLPCYETFTPNSDNAVPNRVCVKRTPNEDSLPYYVRSLQGLKRYNTRNSTIVGSSTKHQLPENRHWRLA